MWFLERSRNTKALTKFLRMAERRSSKPKTTSATPPKKTPGGAKAFNDMSHLKLKRFPDGDARLKPGALRNRAEFPHDAVAEIDPSGRSACKLCGSKIPKGDTRLVLMLQCHLGYRVACTLHFDCFWQHDETAKLGDVAEIHVRDAVGEADRARIREAFETTLVGGRPNKKHKRATKEEPEKSSSSSESA